MTKDDLCNNHQQAKLPRPMLVATAQPTKLFTRNAHPHFTQNGLSADSIERMPQASKNVALAAANIGQRIANFFPHPTAAMDYTTGAKHATPNIEPLKNIDMKSTYSSFS